MISKIIQWYFQAFSLQVEQKTQFRIGSHSLNYANNWLGELLVKWKQVIQIKNSFQVKGKQITPKNNVFLQSKQTSSKNPIISRWDEKVSIILRTSAVFKVNLWKSYPKNLLFLKFKAKEVAGMKNEKKEQYDLMDISMTL